MNQQMSLSILSLCNQVACAQKEDAETTVKRAMLYRFFVEGDPEKGEVAAPVAIEHPVEPGTKRRRKAKEENKVPPVPEFLQAKPMPKYEDIQAAMFKLFEREHGIEAAGDILSSFGVSSAVQLKQENYRECMDLLDNALSGKPL